MWGKGPDEWNVGMKKFSSYEEVIDFAIAAETAAAKLYREMACRAESGVTRDVLLGFAAEERTHRLKLEAIKERPNLLPVLKVIPTIMVNDDLEAMEPSSDMTFEEAVLFAMKCEVRAMNLYLDLSKTIPSESLKMIFAQLAQEEGRHYTRFETICEADM